MATMSRPSFDPTPVPAGALQPSPPAAPLEATITFKLVPGARAVSTLVQYVITSSFGLEFVKPAAGLVRPEETAASSPEFTANKRTTTLVQDEYRLAKEELTPITRGLGIRKAGGVGGATAEIKVSVVDRLASGELTGQDALPVQIILEKKVG